MDYVLPKPLLQNGKPAVLLASCPGENAGGGLLAYDGAILERIDMLSTTGMTLGDGKLIRLLRADDKLPGGELLVYDSCGVEHYYRLDFLWAAHDVAWDGRCYIVVSSGNNTVFKISADGKVAAEWKMEGEGDSWHLNCLSWDEPGRLVCAFGRFFDHHEWSKHKSDGSGLIFDLDAGKTRVGGLDCPHHPRFFDGALAVCNSNPCEFLQIDLETGKILRKVQLKAWTRGVALSDDYIFVGESNRAIESPVETSIVVLCRKTWDILGRIPLNCDEIYDLLLVPPEIAESARRGFNTNPKRESEQNQGDLFQQAGVQPRVPPAFSDPLPLEMCKVEIACKVPPVFKTDFLLQLECTIKNAGSGTFVSMPPNPVHLSYKWNGAEEGNKEIFVEGNRTALPRSLPPGQIAPCCAEIRAPASPGKFTLTVTLVQEHHVWFDQIDPANAVYAEVMIEP